jgi:multidrug/hemolysin transport system ATP-binding protein
MAEIIKIDALNKSFGALHAVQDLSFQVETGELFAFLGVNGAGKSTTIHMMCGQLPKDSGQIVIGGVDIDDNVDAVKSKIGVVFQSSVLDQRLSVRDNLESRAALYGIVGRAFTRRLGELTELLGFGNLLKQPVGSLSGGQRRRIDIARALLHQPQLLILDEPTTGLDPQTRQLVWQVIGRLRHTAHITVFLTTHYMEEAADADHVVILDAGEIVAEGTPLELKNRYTGDFITLYGGSPETAAALGLPWEPIRDGIRIAVPNTAVAAALISKHPELFADFEVTKGKMDDVFLAATGKQLKEDRTQ